MRDRLFCGPQRRSQCSWASQQRSRARDETSAARGRPTEGEARGVGRGVNGQNTAGSTTASSTSSYPVRTCPFQPGQIRMCLRTEQMPNLLNFLEDKGTLFTNHYTPLISHNAVRNPDGADRRLMAEKFGIRSANSLRTSTRTAQQWMSYICLLARSRRAFSGTNREDTPRK